MVYGPGLRSDIIFPGKSSISSDEQAHMLLVNLALK